MVPCVNVTPQGTELCNSTRKGLLLLKVRQNLMADYDKVYESFSALLSP